MLGLGVLGINRRTCHRFDRTAEKPFLRARKEAQALAAGLTQLVETAPVPIFEATLKECFSQLHLLHALLVEPSVQDEQLFLA